MALDTANIVLPGKGVVALAPPHTAMPDMALFDPDVPATYTGWDVMHTSAENQVSLSKDGGEAETKGSWWVSNLRTTRSDVEWSITANSLQIDKATLQHAFPNGRVTPGGGYAVAADGGSAEKAFIVFMVDGTSKMHIYLPRVDTAIGDAPEVDEENFFEIQLSGTALAATEAVDTDEILAGETVAFYPPVAVV